MKFHRGRLQRIDDSGAIPAIPRGGARRREPPALSEHDRRTGGIRARRATAGPYVNVDGSLDIGPAHRGRLEGGEGTRWRAIPRASCAHLCRHHRAQEGNGESERIGAAARGGRRSKLKLPASTGSQPLPVHLTNGAQSAVSHVLARHVWLCSKYSLQLKILFNRTTCPAKQVEVYRINWKGEVILVPHVSLLLQLSCLVCGKPGHFACPC
ncbi:hypothetical protein PybrP1_008340 [[Pythium] brassicae (nom. inval.)]|nr:hypothetical protein PybrP1_008340 [[Pythium] brassicae (nom. inval.)]